MRTHRKRTCRICNLLALLAVVLAIFTFLFVNRLNSNIREVCEYRCKTAVNKVITKAVSNQLKGSADYIEIDREGDTITSIRANTSEINELKNSITNDINTALENISNDTLDIPIGTLSGVVFLSNVGPDIPLQLNHIGAVDVDLKSELTSAGINQTRHRIYLSINTKVKVIMPGYHNDVPVNSEYLVSETIIVGKVPDTYLGSISL